MGRAMRKRIFGHMRTAKVQVSLHIRQSDQGLHCLLTETLNTADAYDCRATARMTLRMRKMV